MIRQHYGEPGKLTWATFEDVATRLLPYIIRINVGATVEDAIREAVESPYKVKKRP